MWGYRVTKIQGKEVPNGREKKKKRACKRVERDICTPIAENYHIFNFFACIIKKCTKGEEEER